MQYIKVTIILIFSIPFAYGLPELKTKQATEKLVYVSKDGKVTYYRNDSGELQISLNYSVNTILKNKPFTQYRVTANSQKTQILIEVIAPLHKNILFSKNNKIYIGNYGENSQLKLLAQGVNPQFELDGTWYSYYDKVKKEIIVASLNNKSVNPRKIKLQNSINPYYTPHFQLINPENIIYTDLNRKGFEAVLMYSFLKQKFETVYKTSRVGHALNYCLKNTTLIIQETSLSSVAGSTQIISIPIYNNPAYKNSTLLYSSALPDLPGLICHKEKIYFIKTEDYKNDLNSKKNNIAKLNPSTKELKIITTNNYLENIFSFGSMIIGDSRGKNYIIESSGDVNTDIIKKPENLQND